MYFWGLFGFIDRAEDVTGLLPRGQHLCDALMQRPVSVCSHHYVLSLSVLPSTLSDWSHVTSKQPISTGQCESAMSLVAKVIQQMQWRGSIK